jgi:lipopolysaccharide/colanic/teichoic acid biosynthesis glycosyltransferase
MINDGKIIENEVLKYTKDGFETIPLASKIYTKCGRKYEKYQIVELPQLLNVIKGDLSLVGYRPLPHKNIILLKNAYGEYIVGLRHKYRAGLTGYSQILGKDKFTPLERINLELLLSSNLYNEGKLKFLKTYLTVLLDTFFLVIFDKTFFIK